MDRWQDNRLMIGVVLAGVALVAWWALARPCRPHTGNGGNSLDRVLMHWNARDSLTLRGLLDGGVLITGRPGSGKSSSSSFQLLRAVATLPTAGGLILSASPGDLAQTRRAFGQHAHRLIVFDATASHRFNVISFLMECGGSTKDILSCIYAIAETVARGSGQAGGDDGSFFSTGARRVIECAIIVMKNATGMVTPAGLLEFITTAASSLQEVHSEEFKMTFHYRMLKAAFEREKSPVESFDYELARSFFTIEFPKMADRTRTSLVAVVMNTLHIFNSGTNRLLFATDTTISPKLMDDGFFIFVDTPISRDGQEGAFALGVFKFITEWYALRRDSRLDNPPLIIHVDEFHNSINAFDTRFLGECRKFGSCMIACTQSKASFYANMPGENAEAQVDALLNNFSHKIIHALGDIKTAEWCSQLIGSEVVLSLGGSERQPLSVLDAWLGQGNGWTGSFSEQIRPVVDARKFLHGFRTGGIRNGLMCDAVVIRSGEPFESNGENFIFTAFSQK